MPESGKSDELKGRIKEATGALADDEELKREGRVDRTAGKLKRRIGKVVDRAKDMLSGRQDSADR